MRISRRLATKPIEENPRSTDLEDPPTKTENSAVLVPRREEFLRDLTKLGNKREPESPEPE
jgi:hypothetical protein